MHELRFLNFYNSSLEEAKFYNSSLREANKVHVYEAFEFDFTELRLKSLPNSICEWKSLKSLRLLFCSMLEELPSDIGSLESLKDLAADQTAIKELPSSIIDLKNIESNGSFINVELPPDLFDYNYVGFVLSAVVAPCLDHQDGLEEYQYWLIQWNCNLKSKNGDPCVKTGTFGKGACLNYDIRSNHLFVDLRVDISPSELLRYDNEITFQFYIRDDMKQHYKVEKCGVHLMFARHCKEVNGSSRIGEDEDGLSLANAHDNCEEEDELIKVIKLNTSIFEYHHSLL
ncbi:hypothetical protein EZV62_003871 [Acer yangbiense]|uniref:Uncharacterized protein n=1 Tax=Acer yangbiense TaxID=1000413 RepID=A0A5C7IKF1_9ROSI|nr:hypothetical protein EZV62_003871 [Acer yangbiense]